MNDERIREMIRAGRVAYGLGIDLPDRATGESLGKKEYERIMQLYRDVLATEPDLPKPEIFFSFAVA